MHEISVDRSFNASHALRLYDGSIEPAHGHDWRVLVHVAADTLDAIECVMDFHELERIVDAALRPLAGAMLNDLDAFARVNPSAERVAEHIHHRIAPALPPRVTLDAVTVTEAPGCRATYRP